MDRLPLVLTMFLLAQGCAASRAAMPSMQPMAFEGRPAAPELKTNHFGRDRSALTEEALREILAAPVFLEEGARLGVVPVADRYEPDGAVPVEAAPSTLVDALESSGLFELSSEVSTEWPVDRGLPGLRELAARYRTEYLLLYRHRFNESSHLNGWAALYATVVGAFFVPGTVADTAGVLEATLYDVKTGTILFTVLERVRDSDSAAPPAVEGRLKTLQAKLVKEGAKALADQVLARCRRLVASRPAKEGELTPETAQVVVAPAR